MWPEKLLHVLDYLAARADEPCGRTVPASFHKTLLFMEQAAEIAPGSGHAVLGLPTGSGYAVLGREPALLHFLEELAQQLSQGKGVITKKACQIPAAIVGAWEELVMDESEPLFVRGFAWFKFLK